MSTTTSTVWQDGGTHIDGPLSIGGIPLSFPNSTTSFLRADGRFKSAVGADSGVIAGTYGSATQAPVLTVNTKGVITAASAATLVIPGVVQLAQVVTSGSQATVDFSNIPAGYASLKLVYTSRDTQAGTAGTGLYLRINNDSTSGDYTNTVRGGTNGTTTITTQVAPSAGGYCGDQPTDGSTAGMAAIGEITIPNYAGTAFYKAVHCVNAYDFSTLVLQDLYFRWTSTAAITRLTVIIGVGGSSFKDNSVWTLYGLR